MRQLLWLVFLLSLGLVFWLQFRTRLARSLKMVAWLYVGLLVVRLLMDFSVARALLLGGIIAGFGLTWVVVWYVSGRIVQRPD